MPTSPISDLTDLPMVKYREAKSLSLGVCPQICLKAKRVDGRQESFDGVQRRAWHGSVLCHMTSGGKRIWFSLFHITSLYL